MPATEQTWRPPKLMHVIFAVTGVLLLISTVWMLAADHAREWKPYQRTAREIDLQMTEWREQQYLTDDLEQQRETLQLALREERSQAIDDALLAQFKQEVQEDSRRRKVEEPSFSELDQLQKQLKAEAQEAAQLRERVQGGRQKVVLADQEIAKAQTELQRLRSEAQGAENAEQHQAAITATERHLQDLQQTKQKLLQALEQERERLAAAEEQAAEARAALFTHLQDEYLVPSRFREDLNLNERKFLAADLDAAKADLGLAVRDNRTDVLAEKQENVDRLKEKVIDKTLQYQAASEYRQQLLTVVGTMKASEEEANKKLQESIAELERLRESLDEQRATYVNWGGPGQMIPLPGKRVLELPILDAFNSPLKIENLWTDGLTIDYNFAKVRRFDRCTTCHQAIQRTLPGSATEPAYVHNRLLNVTVFAPTQEELDAYRGEMAELHSAVGIEPGDEEAEDSAMLGHLYGVNLADEGLIARNDVTVSFVQPQSPAARGVLQYDAEASAPRTGEQLRDLLLQPVAFPTKTLSEEQPVTTTEPRQGLMVGDVIVAIDGDEVRSRAEAQFRLRDAAGTGEPLQLTVRRGLPNPFTSHPRLDLFVGSLSPHDMTKFGCTVCHEGQGSATAFKWASHTPNTLLDQQEWADEHGWFDNHHWIYPMYPKRFAQSSCLKCHHNVVELEPSERFPDPPAPKLMHGYHLIRKFGCYGCHEINGYSGGEMIGPDLRLEPNYSGAAQQLAWLLREPIEQYQQQLENQASEGEAAEAETPLAQAQLDTMLRMQEVAQTVGLNPEVPALRRELVQMLAEGLPQPPPAEGEAETATAAADAQDAVLPPAIRELAPLFDDVERPGELRRAGPSLRYVDHKLDPQFMFDWIHNPQHFRPSTRMPRFFGLWGHLEGHTELAEAFEPAEVLGMVAYLRRYSQDFEYLQPPAGVAEASAERGKVMFQERGCLACHSHQDFPEVEGFRDENEIVQGPDLSGLRDKFDENRNPQGAAWLYSWIRNPFAYHSRTLMPDTQLDVIEQTDAEGNTTVTDPVADIVAYLLDNSVSWEPVPLAQALFSAEGELTVDETMEKAINGIVLEHLAEAFYDTLARQYLAKGIPEDLRSELKGAELELLVPVEQFNDPDSRVSVEQKLAYLGNRTISKYGCYACHDIPGFEAAKPIGTTLADWGRKEPGRLAFEHIVQYLHDPSSLHGFGAHGERQQEDREHPAGTLDEMDEYFMHEIEAGHREGFLYQKLREPRSYDYHKTQNKKYNEWLRMPQFPLDHDQREAVMTFVLGLVAAPPADQFVYKAEPRREAIVEGRQVLEKFNCGGCHVLETEKWQVAYEPGQFGEQIEVQTYPFLRPDFTTAELLLSQEVDRRGLRDALLSGMPTVNDDGEPLIYDDFGDPIEADGVYDPRALELPFELYDPGVVDGFAYQSGVLPINVKSNQIERRNPAVGGTLARYLLPHVVAREKQLNPAAKGGEAWGWLPPPLNHEGSKVQADWLHNFLLDPYPIRPAVVLRMPRFNMSSEEASKLVNYFAAVDNAQYPYDFHERRRREHLVAENDAYQGENRLSDAMKIVTDQNYCIKCHIVGDFDPAGRGIAKAPNLAMVYQRLRGDYLRDWIANPKHILPYTSMPVNIPYDPNAPNLGGVSQTLYQGTSIEQLDALVDLLMNYDEYAKERSRIAPLVQQAAPATQPGGEEQPPADGAQPPAAPPASTQTSAGQ